MKTLALLFLFITSVWADFREEYQATIAKGDAEAVGRFLERSREKERDHPDYYALASKFWWEQATHLSLSTKPAKNDEIAIVDPKTGHEVGSLGTTGARNPELVNKALLLASEGARRFPERLDLSFGLAWVQFQSGNKEEAVSTILALLRTAKAKPNELKWTGNTPLPEPAGIFVPESIHGYTTSLLREKTAEGNGLCHKLCEATIDAYPDHPYAYNMLAALADADGNRVEAIRLLKIAHEKAPSDPLILLNLAETYQLGKAPKEAIAAYQKLLTLEIDEETRATVLEGLRELGVPQN